MRNAFVIFVVLCGCTYEPKDIHYEFKMINDTDSTYIVKRHYRDAQNGSRTDTLDAGSEMVYSVPRVGSYGEPFGESLINSFFDTLNVEMADTKKKINVHKRSHWKENLELDKDFLEKPGSVKGKVIYTLKMRDIIR